MSCKVILYGAGAFGKEVGYMLKTYKEVELVCYLDQNMVGQMINGCTVLHPKDVLGIQYDFIFLCSKNSAYLEEMKQELLKRNVAESQIISDPFFGVLQKYFNKVDKVKLIKDCIHLVFQKDHIDSSLECGDFTWYVPQIHGSEQCASIKIGKFCNIARDVMVFRGGEINWKCGTLFDFRNFFEEYEDVPYNKRSKGNVVIGNDVLLYSGVKVLSGVTIGDGAVVAANSLVGKDIPPYAVAWGVPAKVVMYRFDALAIEKLKEMQWWDWKYEQIYNAIPYLQSENINLLYDYYLSAVKGRNR